MRRYAFLLLCTLALAALTTAVAATVASAHSTPQIRAEQAHERAVLAEVNQIGVKLQAAQDARWNAIQQLKLVKQSLHQNEYRLHVARGNLHAAQQRLMSRLYSLYVNGSPSTIEVIAGAHSLSQVIDRAESARVLSNQDAALGTQALHFEHAVQARERQLKQLKQKRVQAVARRNAEAQTVARRARTAEASARLDPYDDLAARCARGSTRAGGSGGREGTPGGGDRCAPCGRASARRRRRSSRPPIR